VRRAGKGMDKGNRDNNVEEKGGEKRNDAPHFFLSLYIVKSWTKYCERGCRPIGYV